MKLLFSEAAHDYAHYTFPYAVWGIPEAGETPADLFERGFLPSGGRLDRFYLCRQVRVAGARFQLSSENRRILRKGVGIRCRLVPRAEYVFDAERRARFRGYADAVFGTAVMTEERLDRLFHSAVVTHLLQFDEEATGREIGTALLYLEEPRLAYYYYAFYDLAYRTRNLGMFMMTTAVHRFCSGGAGRVHLGTCYSTQALYKTQFSGIEFWDGFRWADNLEELKFLVRHRSGEGHLLEQAEFRRTFCPEPEHELALRSPFRSDRCVSPTTCGLSRR